MLGCLVGKAIADARVVRICIPHRALTPPQLDLGFNQCFYVWMRGEEALLGLKHVAVGAAQVKVQLTATAAGSRAGGVAAQIWRPAGSAQRDPRHSVPGALQLILRPHNQCLQSAEAQRSQIAQLRLDGATIDELELAFTLPGFDHIELKPGGAGENVTLDTLQAYIDVSTPMRLHVVMAGRRWCRRRSGPAWRGS